jgi:hypothetical protein
MQNYENHRRVHVPYHLVIVPIFWINLALTIIRFARQPSIESAWIVVVAIGMVLMVAVMRTNAVRVQDRVIRLEMRVRLQAVAPGLVHFVDELSPRQVVALRFAGDAELPDLMRRAKAGEFAATRDIKRVIKDWRPDTLRV